MFSDQLNMGFQYWMRKTVYDTNIFNNGIQWIAKKPAPTDAGCSAREKIDGRIRRIEWFL
jgi:hypothetical protein